MRPCHWQCCRLESEFYKLSKLSAVLTRLKELREQTRKNKAIGALLSLARLPPHPLTSSLLQR